MVTYPAQGDSGLPAHEACGRWFDGTTGSVSELLIEDYVAEPTHDVGVSSLPVGRGGSALGALPSGSPPSQARTRSL